MIRHFERNFQNEAETITIPSYQKRTNIPSVNFVLTSKKRLTLFVEQNLPRIAAQSCCVSSVMSTFLHGVLMSPMIPNTVVNEYYVPFVWYLSSNPI